MSSTTAGLPSGSCSTPSHPMTPMRWSQRGLRSSGTNRSFALRSDRCWAPTSGPECWSGESAASPAGNEPSGHPPERRLCRDMRSCSRHPQPPSRMLAALAVIAAFVIPAGALGAPASPRNSRPERAPGALVQLPGGRGCLVDRSTPHSQCGSARALQGPAPFLGSGAVALSPDGRNLYVASSRSDAIAIFTRNARTGTLTQRRGTAGCIAAKGGGGCGTAIGLDGPNSVAVGRDGRSVYATSLESDALTVFRRDRSTGALSQLRGGGGCISGLPLPGCAGGRALVGPDVVTVSPDGENVYVGSFFGNAIAVFDRDASSGALTQPTDTTGCIVEVATSGCATGLALGAPEGMAVSGDGASVYVATAVSNALVAFSRDPSTGALTQATDGTDCVVAGALNGCTTGAQLSGANAVAISPDDEDVYVTSLL